MGEDIALCDDCVRVPRNVAISQLIKTKNFQVNWNIFFVINELAWFTYKNIVYTYQMLCIFIYNKRVNEGVTVFRSEGIVM